MTREIETRAEQLQAIVSSSDFDDIRIPEVMRPYVTALRGGPNALRKYHLEELTRFSGFSDELPSRPVSEMAGDDGGALNYKCRKNVILGIINALNQALQDETIKGRKERSKITKYIETIRSFGTFSGKMTTAEEIGIINEALSHTILYLKRRRRWLNNRPGSKKKA